MRITWIAATLSICLFFSSTPAYASITWVNENGTWRMEEAPAGSYKGEWKEIDGEVYRYNEKGRMITGWISVDGKTYYMKRSGAMARDEWVTTYGNRYYLTAGGEILRNGITPDGLPLGPDGTQVQVSSSPTWEELMFLADIYYYSYQDKLSEMVERINADRRNAGVGELQLNEKLSKVSTARALHMYYYDYFSHYYQDILQCKTVAGMYQVDDNVGENIVWNNSVSIDPQYLVVQWEESPEHFQNMLNPNYLEMGLSFVPTDNGVFSVQILSSSNN